MNQPGRDMPSLAALAHETHVWFSTPALDATADQRAGLVALLDDTERGRYGRFVFDKDRYHFLAAHVLVRVALSRYVGVPPGDWRFTTNAYGRPEIAMGADFPRLRFNLSHTNGLVACAISGGSDCGVDVEELRPFRDFQSIAQGMFSRAEYEHLLQTPAPRQQESFLNLWTLKEAYVKARGMGLSLSTSNLTFTIAGSGRISVRFEDDPYDDGAAWQFELIRPTARHVAAVCVQRKPGAERQPVRSRWWSSGEHWRSAPVSFD